MVFEKFTSEEMASIHFCYGLADGNGNLARRFYSERFPNRRLPDRQVFVDSHRRLMESGMFYPKCDRGRNRDVRTPALEEAILHQIEVDPSKSTREISEVMGVNHVIVWQVLKENLLWPYHIQRVQGLLPADFQPRIQFCEWYLQQCAENREFEMRVIFSDEASFSRDGIFNYHNSHVWAFENPHEIVEKRHQQTFSVNVWAGIIGDNLLGPVFLPNRLNGVNYLEFLQEQLPVLLEDVPLNVLQNHYFMHDGAPAHFSLIVRAHLNEVYGERWIGRGGPVAWPARSPDLNSCDFFLWGYVKSLVYKGPIPDEETLRQRIITAFDTIRNNFGVFGRTRQSMRRRAEACILANGAHFEHFL